MGFFNWLSSNPVADIAKPIEAVSDLYTTDKARLEAQKDLEEVQQKRGLAQLENNRIMAMSSRLFDSGWQPMLGWSAGFCIALYYIPQLIVTDYIWIKQSLEMKAFLTYPIDPNDLLNLVYLLFGFGTYHLVKKKIIG